MEQYYNASSIIPGLTDNCKAAMIEYYCLSSSISNCGGTSEYYKFGPKFCDSCKQLSTACKDFNICTKSCYVCDEGGSDGTDGTDGTDGNDGNDGTDGDGTDGDGTDGTSSASAILSWLNNCFV
eukprot:TRINITY_DN7923_c0_g1_i2.p1 TRINITY_DN7923_c0_g1~~TRINITY_DN7923_c0_g1_i2.p1  ORF type:complete len:124 (-),score=21.19 TRINITY_DN7923_c0_g1_i2:61-432(-)